MKELVKYEYRKMWNHLTTISVISLVVVATILNFLFYTFTTGAINSKGERVAGLKSYREIKSESKDIKGTINQEYLDNLVKKFNSSKEKENFENRLGNDLSKYNFSNRIINFANYGKDMNDRRVGLNFDFLKSESEFYKQYKEALGKTIKSNNEKNWFKYSEEQFDKIDEKIDKLKGGFNVDYNLGLDYFRSTYGNQYWIILIVIGFALSSIFSKDSNNGIDELILSSKLGRKKNMNARIISGNIFAIVVYAIFIGTHLIESAAVFSLQGWGASAQNIWYTCLYDISIGTSILIMILQGLVGVLIVANLVMLISIKVKYSKLTTILSLLSIWILIRLTYTTNSLQLQLNPIYFATRLTVPLIIDFEIYYFIGNVMIPYSIVFIGLASIYMLIIRVLTVREYKRYKLN